MTLKEMKIKTFSLIEEYYPSLAGLAEDEDVLNKINGVVNQIQMDLMKYKRIKATREIDIEANDDKEVDISNYIDDLYQIDRIKVPNTESYELIADSTLILPDDYVGTIKIYYYRYPELAKLTFASDDAKTRYDNSFELEIDADLQEIMPYGIAADLLKMDMISNYGRYFREEYESRKASIDMRKSSGMITIVGGCDV